MNKRHHASVISKHMDDIISGEFSKNMMIDWDNDDVNLLTWRAATAETNFEKKQATTALFLSKNTLIMEY
jgi:ketol-acid reductoisomerase